MNNGKEEKKKRRAMANTGVQQSEFGAESPLIHKGKVNPPLSKEDKMSDNN